MTLKLFFVKKNKIYWSPGERLYFVPSKKFSNLIKVNV